MTSHETTILNAPGENSVTPQMNQDNFKIGFLAGVGRGNSRASIQSYFKHVLPVWAASDMVGYSGVEEAMGYFEGQLHRVRMAVYGKTVPNWQVIAQCARCTFALTMDKADIVAVVKRQLNECVAARGSVAKVPVADGIMWGLAHNPQFMAAEHRFRETVERKLSEFIMTMHEGLTDEQDLHMHLQHLTYYQFMFPTFTPPIMCTPVKAPLETPTSQVFQTRSGRTSRPPQRLTA